MKWYFAVCSAKQADYLVAEGVKSILISYHYCKKGLPEGLVKASKNKGVNIMVDSGAFTNFSKPGSVRLQDYIEFLKEYEKQITEYITLDDIRKRQVTIKNFDKMRDEGLSPLFVDHLYYRFNPRVGSEYKRGVKLCWGGLYNAPWTKKAIGGKGYGAVLKRRLEERAGHARKSPTSKLHFLAVGQKLRKFLPYFDVADSFDSAIWAIGPQRFGQVMFYVPPSKEKPFPRLIHRKPDEVPPEIRARASKLHYKLADFDDRTRFSIREMKAFYSAMEKFYIDSKKKGADLIELAKSDDDESDIDLAASNPIIIQVQWQGARAATAEQHAEAERAARKNKLTLGKFFYQPKPTRPAFPEELQTVERFLSLYKERPEWMPTFVQKKYDGARHQVHKDGKTVKIFSEDGGDNTARLPGTVKEILALKEDKLVLDVEIERWAGKQHLPREAIAGFLNAKDKPDDSDVVTNIFDVLYTGKEGDIHEQPAWHRLLKVLPKLGVKQSTMGAPDLSKRLNAAPGTKVYDLGELEREVRKIRKLPGSEGVVAKQADSTYPLKLVTPDSWVKYHNATTIRGVVYGSEKTKGGVWVYQYGVLPGNREPTETIEVGTRKIVPVGDTFATKLDFKEGDGILIEAETVNIERGPKGEAISAWVPRVIGPWTGKLDTTDSAAQRAKGNLVLQVKEIDEEGNVEYLPTRKMEKQADPYLEIPDEDGKYRFVIHEHWRGKSMHTDLRIVLRPGKLLIGWTLNTQIAGAVKEPVTTLAQARALASQRPDEYSKINWTTGEWAERPKRGTTKPVRTTILAERKAPEPYEWIDVEGKTKEPEEGERPPVGGTRFYPGVFKIRDQGDVEYGAQKAWFHEYFLQGRHNRYRIIFRQLKLGQEKYRHSRSLCMRCRKKAPVVDVLWAEGRARAWFCKTCFPKWKKEIGEDNVDFVKEVTTGEVPENWKDVHKGVELPFTDEEVVITKTVLPPSKPEAGTLGRAAWFCMRPDDLTPYVLDSDAVKKNWMPPQGASALPRAVRSQVPKDFQYWKTKDAKKAKAVRDALVEALRKKKVKLDFEAVYKSTEKTSLLDARFVLQEQTWRGPIQIRVGPSRTLWWLRLDVGRPKLVAFEMYLNPIDNDSIAARRKDDTHKDSMKLSGAIKPGHYLNPTKDTPSNIEILDSGKATVLSLSKDFVKVKLEGKNLKGLFQLQRNEDEWAWSPSQPGPETKKRGEEMGEQFKAEIKMNVQIAKVDKEKRMVTGVVLEPDEVDAQNDTIDEDAIEAAAYSFLAKFNRGTELGVMHKLFGNVGLELCESWVSKTEQRLGGETVKKGSWLMTVKVVDDKLWKKVKAGEITGFSIGGVATVA